MRPHVILKMCSGIESFPADLTVVFVGACVGLHVLFQVAFCRISFTAGITGKTTCIAGLLLSHNAI